jgi:hypothetical protein
MSTSKDFLTGWDFMSNAMAVNVAAGMAAVDARNNAMINQKIAIDNQRAQIVNEAIEGFKTSMNNHPYKNLHSEQLKGYVAEGWHQHTFNIDALEHGSNHRARTLDSNEFGSVDIETNFGKNYSLKYSNTAKSSENMQAVLEIGTGKAKYTSQERLIPAEQVSEAKLLARRNALKNSITRPEVAAAHNEVENKLVGTISDDNGISSKELSVTEAKQIAEEVKNNEFDPEKHGYKKRVLAKPVKIKYFRGAMKAGVSAAFISAAMQIVPELYKVIVHLIKKGQLSIDQLKRSGKKILSASGEAFLKGATAYSLEALIKKGVFGQLINNMNPSVIGAMVLIISETVKDSLLLAAGKLSPREMGIRFVDNTVNTSIMIATGSYVQALLPNLPILGYLIGTLLGSAIAVVFNIGKNKLISFCVDSGFTAFGLVEQNYQIPEEVLKEMGVDVIPIPRIEVPRVEVERIPVGRDIRRIDYDTIKFTVLKRGLIGVNRVGYVTA